MNNISKHRPSDKQAYRFLLLMLAAFDKVAASEPGELTILTGKVSTSYSKGQASIGDQINMYRVMYILRRRESPKMSEIARALAVSLPAATRIADFLVNNGYAERLSDPKDGRLVRLSLTANGRKEHDVIEDSFLQNMRSNLDFLTVEEQSIFLTLSDKITAAIKKEISHREVRRKKERKSVHRRGV